ncbi:hypothetical protein J4208_05845 [Candidatus Woesearchaeota archaeon]|nr:hypothetical protein [Candidatus Woesearchaeota archaeon]
MQRYLISNELKEAIRNSPYSLRSLSTHIGFNVKNFIYCNKSINQEHLQKLSTFLELERLSLDTYEQDYARNLGILAHTLPIKPVRKSSMLAEFIGMMLGDGNIYENGVRISCDSRWPEYISYIEELMYHLFGIYFKQYQGKGNCIHLYVYNRLLVNKLLELGLERGDKILNNVGVPRWIKNNKIYAEHCVRGLMDTDGCLYWCKRDRQFYFNFKNTCKRIYYDFGEMTDALGYHFCRSTKVSYQLYRKADVRQFIKEIRPLKAVRVGLISSV